MKIQLTIVCSPVHSIIDSRGGGGIGNANVPVRKGLDTVTCLSSLRAHCAPRTRVRAYIILLLLYTPIRGAVDSTHIQLICYLRERGRKSLVSRHAYNKCHCPGVCSYQDSFTIFLSYLSLLFILFVSSPQSKLSSAHYTFRYTLQQLMILFQL